MKKPTAKKTKVSNNPEETKEWINRTLKRIHRKMIELFGVDFTYFSDIKIIKQSDILKQLTQRIQNNFKENGGVVYSDIKWKQIRESLSKNQVTGFFENFAFYNPEDDVLYMNEKMITNHPEKIIPVCTHELAEKLLSTYLSSPLKTPTRTLVEAYIEAKKTGNTRKLYELLNTHTDMVFKSVFKEGVCEAIALQTLRHIDSEMKVASLEKELQIGHSKCIDLLFYLGNAKKNVENVEKNQPVNEKKLIKEILKISQIIKGLSYYLGYPLAKAVMEKYGIEGATFALEKCPPLKAQYFANPQAYLAQLETENV
ncbi:MAG: hypothetical protein AOA66_0796 [Candidatus Bathyarchaeota archaeon BA2]|nr:MAG: hypothetical protein AOA66_0796 [Candidatus Bathyarchaeota archaeon BA2]